MDLSKFTSKDLQALRARNLSEMSVQGLQALREQAATAPAEAAPTSTLESAKAVGKGALGGLQKLTGSLRTLSTGPLTGLALKAITGKKVFDASDILNGVNPTNLKQFPSNSEMFQRAGVKNPSLSDVFPSWYADPGKGEHMYTPEKGGALDPSLAGAVLQTATDPAMYLGMGEAGLAAKGLDTAAKAVGGLDRVVNPLSMVTRAAGKKMYSSPLAPLERAAERTGKSGVAETLYGGGVMTPTDLPSKAQAVTDDLMAARNKIFDQASAQGGQASMERAVAPLRARVAQIRASQDPRLQDLATKMEGRADDYLKVERGTPGTPGTPPTVQTRQSPILDETGQPFTHEEVLPGTPGTPGVPPKAVTPGEASGYKTSIYKTQPKGAYNEAVNTDAETELDDLLAQGQRESAEEAVRSTLGDPAGDQVATLNEKAAKLLSTRAAQQQIADKAAKQADGLTHLTPADLVTGAAGAAGGGTMGKPLEGALLSILAKKGASALQQLEMPTGYLTRKLGETRALDRLMELTNQGAQYNGKEKSRTGR